MWVTTDCGQRHKLQDLICWNFLESRRCVKHAELLQSRGLQAVIVPIPPKHSRQPKHIVAQLAAGHDDLSDTTRQPDANRSVITQYAGDIHRELSNEQIPSLLDSELSVKPGAKCYKWERLGVPLRIEVGQQEIQTDTVTIVVNPGLRSAVTAGLKSSNSSSCCGSKLLERYIAPAATAVGLSQKQGLRLPGVALADCVAACCELLSAAAAGAAAAADLPRTHLQQQQQQGLSSPNSNSSSGSWPCLLPNGYSNKLHLWSSSSSSSNMSSSSRPCPAHMRHLLGLGKPCFCGAAPHVTLEDLQSEITHQLTAASAAHGCSSAMHFHQCESAAAAAAAAAAQCTQDLPASQAAVSDSGNARIANQNVADTSVGIFVSGVPKNLAAAAVRQQLQQQFQNFQEYCNAVVPAVGRKNRGWARVMMRSIVEAEKAMRELDGQLVMSPNTAALQLSWCCGRADALFPDLHYDIRRQLRIDAVAAYSMTDSSTAAAMAALLAAVAAVVKAWHRVTTAASTALCAAAACYKLGTRCDSSSSSSDLGSSSSTASGLSATDLTACAGGNVIAFMKHFSSVTAVELDPDRAEDLLHNIRVVLQPSLPPQQQQQQHCDNYRDSKNLQASASSADSDKQAQSAAFDAAVVPHFAVMHSQQQQQCRHVAVICGDAVELANQLQQQDVLFLDPPWGGPNYQQQQQNLRCAQQSSDSHSSSSRRTGCPVQSKLPQSSPAAEDSSKSAINGGLDTTGLCLSGVPLQDLCSQLLQKCYILAVKLPSRWSGIDNFCKTVIQLVDDMRKQHFSTEAAMRGKLGCIRARYGRSELVMFVRTPGVSETRRVDGQQQHIWIKQLRGCLKEHH